MHFKTFVTEETSLDQLDWENMNRVVISPGRFNPPHLGHKVMVDALIKLGEKLNAEPTIIVVDSGKRDATNPLSGDLRVEYLHKMFPSVRIEIAKNPFDAVEKLAKEYNAVPVGGVTGSDRAESYKKMIGRMYGPKVEGNYTSVVLHRDPDSADGDVKGISASKVRAAALANDINRVRAMTGLSDEDAKRISKIIQQVSK